MALTASERDALTALARDAMKTIEELFYPYARRGNAPERFALALYDASDAAGSRLTPEAAAERMIAELRIGEDQWGERNYATTAQNKIRVAIRTGRNTGDLVRGAQELFEEGDMKAPGAVLGEVNGKAVAAAGSGLRGPEDEALAQLLLQLMNRLSS
jgi:hypothetical protein